MNRKIKFEYGFQGVNGIIKKVYHLSEIPNIKNLCDVWNEIPVLYSRQFTGLTDKNGKEAFEGDITDEGVIIWHNEYLGFFVKDEQGKHTPLYAIPFFEVIGNIYENPELLK